MRLVLTYSSLSGLISLQSALFLAIAEVYNNEGDEAYFKEDYSNAIYFYTEGIKVNCKDIDLKGELYSNRAYANLCSGEAIWNLGGTPGEGTPLHWPKLVCTVQQLGMVLGSLLRSRY